MAFTPKSWVDGQVPNGQLNAAAMIDLETRLSAYSDTNLPRDYPTNGEMTIDRGLAYADYQARSSQTLFLQYWRAQSTRTVNTVSVQSGNTAAAGLTLCRFGIYTLDGSFNGTLAASTVNDTTLLGAAYTGYSKALSGSFNIVAGTLYAFGALQVGTTTATIQGTPNGITLTGVAPHFAAYLVSQSNLPASFTNAGLGGEANTGTWAFLS